MLFIALAIFVSVVGAQCTREFLKDAAAVYVFAQRAGDPSGVLDYTSPNTIYVENNVRVSIDYNSTLTKPLRINYDYSIYDTAHCAIFTEIVAATDLQPTITHTRIAFLRSIHTISRIESVVTDRGDWLFNATSALGYIYAESWSPVPKEKQETREYLEYIGNAYFDRFSNASVVVPWGLPCYRIEGGLYANGTMNNVTGICEQAMPSNITVPRRGIVVDEELGAVSVFVGFPGLDRTQGKEPMPDSHFFRVEDHKIKYLHTASVCVTPGCGEFDPDHPF